MQVIIPVAGRGSRMRPHTHTTHKALLHVAGRPCIDYILDELKEIGVTEIIFITGHLKEQFENHMREAYDFDMHFIEQKTLDGTSGAIKLARDLIKEDVLVIFADTIFDVDLSVLKDNEWDGVIWGKKVEDYKRFGIMVTDDNGFLQKLIEKPDEPYTRLANIGMYYVKNYKLMFECIDEQYKKNLKAKGEYPLPEVYSMMAEKGEKIKILEVDGWYDTGKPETTLESQNILLKKRHREGNTKNTKIISPVYIEEGAEVEDCTIGPNVSIGSGSVVKNSTIRDSIVGINSNVSNSTLKDSLVGDDAVVENIKGSVNVGNHSEVMINESNS